jgi:hypothetical protein
MSLYDRLLHLEQPYIQNHAFPSVLGEYVRGKQTRAQVLSAFAISVAEEADFDALVAKMIELPESYPMGAYNVLTNVGSSYDAIAPAKGLGFVALDVTGITQATVRIRYNKVGSGTLTWQLWNETNSVELGTLDDAAAAGDNKQGDIVVTPASPLSGGTKLLRLRVKSTTATDDPVYYGSCLFVRRVARLTSTDLHEILCIADQRPRVSGYDTDAALRARFGVS